MQRFWGSQNRTVDPLEIELQMILSLHVVAGNWTLELNSGPLLRAASAFNCGTVSSAPYYNFLNGVCERLHVACPSMTNSSGNMELLHVGQAAGPLQLYPDTAAEPALVLSPHLRYEREVFCLFVYLFIHLFLALSFALLVYLFYLQCYRYNPWLWEKI